MSPEHKERDGVPSFDEACLHLVPSRPTEGEFICELPFFRHLQVKSERQFFLWKSPDTSKEIPLLPPHPQETPGRVASLLCPLPLALWSSSDSPPPTLSPEEAAEMRYTGLFLHLGSQPVCLYHSVSTACRVCLVPNKDAPLSVKAGRWS